MKPVKTEEEGRPTSVTSQKNRRGFKRCMVVGWRYIDRGLRGTEQISSTLWRRLNVSKVFCVCGHPTTPMHDN